MAAEATAETIRVATFAAPLSREGPGLLLRDMARDDDQISAVLAIIARVSPDVLVLTDFDYDLDGLAMQAFADRAGYAHAFTAEPNSGRPTGLDVDGNGRFGEARDAQGYGRFTGDGGLAILSRWPIGAVQEYTDLLWRDLPGAVWPPEEPDAVIAVQRLSSTAHWDVEIDAPEGAVHLLTWSATPPVFDGPEDRNGLRNRDELRLIAQMMAAAAGDFVVAGNANLDPQDGDGIREAMTEFLSQPELQDPEPASRGGRIAADPDHTGDPAQDTVDWPDGAPGNLRVSYVLPGATWRVGKSGVFWPAPDDPDADLLGNDGLAAGPHRLVWVDISR